MVDVSPPGRCHLKVVITDSGTCSGCLYKKALLYMLDHCTGTGRLVLTGDELHDLKIKDLELLVVSNNELQKSKG